MPYVIITSQITLANQPTKVGDEFSDLELMNYLGAVRRKHFGNNFEYETSDPPRIVLNKLEQKGYKLITSCGIDQTCVWTLYKSDAFEVEK